MCTSNKIITHNIETINNTGLSNNFHVSIRFKTNFKSMSKGETK